MKSGFLYTGTGNSQLSGNYVEELIAQAKRNAARKELQKLGFIWNKTSGVPAGQRWNIDNWPMQSLENIMRAYREYGNVVVDLHNRQMFYPENTTHYVQIRSIVEEELENRGDTGSSGDNDNGGSGSTNNGSSGSDSQNQQPIQAGYGNANYPAWMFPAGIVTVTGVSLYLILSS